MPLVTAPEVSRLAIELLRRQLVLAATVSRVPAGELSGPSGGQVSVRVPVPRAAREQATPAAEVVHDQTDELAVSLTVKHWYNSTLLSDEDLTLSLESYGRQVLLPQVESVARAAEDELASELNGLTEDQSIVWASEPDPESDDATVLAIRQRLTENGVPPQNRYCAVAPDIATRLLGIDKFVRADQRGDQGSALAEATIGRVYGLTFVESPALDAGTAVAYHRSAFVLGIATPVDPGGGAAVSIATDSDISLRHVRAYDPNRLATAATTSVFAGASKVVDDDPDDSGEDTAVLRAVRVNTDGS